MKNNFKELEEIHIPEDSQWPIRLAMIVFALIICICVSCAQPLSRKVMPGLGFNLTSSGNGHGAFYAPYVSFGLSDNTFILSGLYQKQTSQFAGMRLGYSRNLSASVHDEWEPEERGYDVLQLNFYSYVQYLHNCQVSDAVMRFEKLKRGEQAADLGSLTYRTAEAGAGLELRIYFSKALSLRNCLGLSVYHHLNKNDLMFHAQTAMSLVVLTGLHFVIY